MLVEEKHHFGATRPQLPDSIRGRRHDIFGFGNAVFHGRIMTVTVIQKQCLGISYKHDEQRPQTNTVLVLWLRSSTNFTALHNQ